MFITEYTVNRFKSNKWNFNHDFFAIRIMILIVILISVIQIKQPCYLVPINVVLNWVPVYLSPLRLCNFNIICRPVTDSSTKHQSIQNKNQGWYWLHIRILKFATLAYNFLLCKISTCYKIYFGFVSIPKGLSI